MALREREPSHRKYRSDVPGSHKGPPKCRKESNGKKCGKAALHTISGQVEIMGKAIPVKFPVCESHLQELSNDAVD